MRQLRSLTYLLQKDGGADEMDFEACSGIRLWRNDGAPGGQPETDGGHLLSRHRWPPYKIDKQIQVRFEMVPS